MSTSARVFTKSEERESDTASRSSVVVVVAAIGEHAGARAPPQHLGGEVVLRGGFLADDREVLGLRAPLCDERPRDERGHRRQDGSLADLLQRGEPAAQLALGGLRRALMSSAVPRRPRAGDEQPELRSARPRSPSR